MMDYDRKLFKFNSRKARENFLELSFLFDHYNGRVLGKGDKWDVEHLYSLSLAWETGFRDQYLADPTKALQDMKDFANDALNLITVSSSSNRSRGNKTLWDWVPLNLAYIGERNKAIKLLADKYNLRMTPEMVWAIKWSDKVLHKHRKGIHMGQVRKWLVRNGMPRIAFPF